MLTHDDMIRALGPRLRRSTGVAATSFVRAVVDSRTVTPGDLFVALPGEHVDGAAFIDDAFARGATAALAARMPDIVPDGRAVYEVDDPLAALQQLARWWRGRMPVTVVAITGTVGKTSTKEITAAVLAAGGRGVLKNEGNLNGEIGLPLMLLRLRPEHDLAVFEFGMYRLGEIALQCELARPVVGLVTNVGYTHASRLGSIEQVARAKGELPAWLPVDATVALNLDDPRVAAMAAATRARVLTYGLASDAMLRAEEVTDHGFDGLSFRLMTPAGSARVRSPLVGRHNVANCLAATAAALTLGMSVPEIAAALSEARNPLRLKVLPGKAGSTIIDDAYNAGPASMAAALDVLAQAPARRRIAVLGDMAELGDDNDQRLHEELGARAAAAADLVLLAGARSRWTAAAARAAGSAEVRYFPDRDTLTNELLMELRAGDTVLIKASRGMAFEHAVHAVAAVPPTAADGAPVVTHHPVS